MRSSTLTLLVAIATVTVTQAAADTARGVVFHDQNQNNRRDPGEPGLPEIRVSNGRDIVVTDAAGKYELPVTNDTTIFIIKPKGWMTSVDDLNLPRFYYTHKPAGSPKLRYPGVEPTGALPEAIDFGLHKHAEPDTFKALIFGDTQPRNIKEIEYIAHDVVEQLVGTDAVFGLSLGDLVFDRLDLFDPLNQLMSKLGFTMYNILGNHDIDFLAPSDKLSDETFERHYGPSYYSFDYGQVHFIVLDDVMWHPATSEKKGHYTGGLGDDQMTFLRNDLKLVPKDRLVVLTMHIPIIEVAERAEIFKLLADFPHNVSFSAHWHVHMQWFLDEDDGWPAEKPHHHTTFVTACGSWWTGAPDEVGIPHTTMRDGAPNGWAVATFDGNEYAIQFRAARRPADYQMNIWTPEAVQAADAAKTPVIVNVFAGSERSTVEMRFENGPWQTLEHVEMNDPYYEELKRREKEYELPGRDLPGIMKSRHVWRGYLPANPPKGTALIEVRTTDMFGHTYNAYRILRIE